MFPDQLQEIQLIAGPFCNLANAASLKIIKKMGFTAAVASPELGHQDYLTLIQDCPLPIGMMVDGFWPVGISRHRAVGVKDNEPFTSPKNESFWTRLYGQNLWIYPAWPMDLKDHKAELQQAGYSFFISIRENLPDGLPERKRPGIFNWELGLL